MSILIEINGTQYDGFTRKSVDITLDTLSGKFSFTSATLKNQITPFAVGDACVVTVEGEEVITGYIEAIEPDYQVDAHNIVIQGRDKTCDVIDSSVGKIANYQSDISLQQIIENELKKANITDIDIITKLDEPISNFKTIENQTSGSDQTLFEYFLTYAQKKQVYLTTDGLGNIVISRSTGVSVPEYLINDPDNPESNIISGSGSYNESNRFYSITVKTQANHAENNLFMTKPKNQENKKAVAYDKDIRESRNLVITVSDSYTTDQLQARAEWERNIRQVESQIYKCTVQGFKRSKDAGIWRPNQLVNVYDKFENLNREMLINDVNFSSSVDDGSITSLTLVDKNAYKIKAQEPQPVEVNEKTINIFGNV